MRGETPSSWASGASVALLTGLLGALAGVGLAVVTDALSRSEICGANWSLSGNGALVVPVAGVPGVLVGGWTALARWRVRDRRWTAAGLTAGLVALSIGALTSFGPVIAVNTLGQEMLRGGNAVSTGNAGAGVGAALAITFGLPLVLAFISGLGLAAVFARLTWPAAITALLLLAVAVAVTLVLPGAFLVVGPLAVQPLMMGLPLLLASGQGGRTALFSGAWLAAACVALVLGLGAGLIAAQQIQGL